MTLRGVLLTAAGWLLYTVVFEIYFAVMLGAPLGASLPGRALGSLLMGLYSVPVWLAVIRGLDRSSWGWRILAHAPLCPLYVAANWYTMDLLSLLFFGAPAVPLLPTWCSSGCFTSSGRGRNCAGGRAGRPRWSACCATPSILWNGIRFPNIRTRLRTLYGEAAALRLSFGCRARTRMTERAAALIAADEAPARQLLAEYLGRFPQIRIVAVCTDGARRCGRSTPTTLGGFTMCGGRRPDSSTSLREAGTGPPPFRRTASAG